MYCSKCGSANPENSRFCQKCGAPTPLKTNAPMPNASMPNASVPPVSAPTVAAPQMPYIPPQNNISMPPAGLPSQNSGSMPQGTGFVPPNSAGYPPPNGINGPPNIGYPHQGSVNIPPNTGFPPQNMGYRPPAGGYNPPNAGHGPTMGGTYPPKKKNPVLIAAGILIGLAVVIVAVVLLATSSPKNNNLNNSPGPSDNVVLASNGDISPDVSGVALADDGFRYNFTEILGNGSDEVTVMIYLCGADLESDGGCGTLDINEMLSADLGDNVNVVIQTGGCYSWSTQGIIDGEVQRWVIQDGTLVELQQLGERPMLDSGELSDFISFSAENFPANRYQFVFWDHGGGSLYGFGSDEIYPETVLFLPDIAAAFENSGIKFDFVGFDACLMGTIEIACMLEPYADYLVGSEETEPAYGWDYTPWFNALGENSSIDTVDLGEVIVDSFLLQNAPGASEQDGPDSTLSIVALREIPKVYDALSSYMSNATVALANKEYKMLSSAVARARSFAEGDYDLVDIMDFATRADLDGLEELASALDSAVKYSDSTAGTGVSGLSMYFPYTDLTVYGYAKEKFAAIGFGGPIYDFYDTFVNILAGGQSNTTTRSLMESVTGQTDTQTDTQTDYSEYAWYDNSEVESYTYENTDYTELEIAYNETTGIWYLPMTDEDWSLITNVEMQVLLDDGEGYIDLGSDQYWETDDDDNLLLNYGSDNTWLAIDGQLVCYYAEETIQTETDTIFIGYVPAVLNGTTDIDIIIERDGEYGEDYIAGYRLVESNSTFGGEGTVGKGYKQFEVGDQVDFICDYYTYDGDFDSSYYFGDTLTIGDTYPTVAYEDVGDGNVLMCYMLVDIYQNYSWTEYVEFSTDYAE